VKFSHFFDFFLFDFFLVSSGVTASTFLAAGGSGSAGELGGVTIPSTVLGPILVGAFTLIAFFLKQYYTAMVNVMTRQNAELKALNVTITTMDKRLAIVETKVSAK